MKNSIKYLSNAISPIPGCHITMVVAEGSGMDQEFIDDLLQETADKISKKFNEHCMFYIKEHSK